MYPVMPMPLSGRPVSVPFNFGGAEYFVSKEETEYVIRLKDGTPRGSRMVPDSTIFPVPTSVILTEELALAAVEAFNGRS